MGMIFDVLGDVIETVGYMARTVGDGVKYGLDDISIGLEKGKVKTPSEKAKKLSKTLDKYLSPILEGFVSEKAVNDLCRILSEILEEKNIKNKDLERELSELSKKEVISETRQQIKETLEILKGYQKNSESAKQKNLQTYMEFLERIPVLDDHSEQIATWIVNNVGVYKNKVLKEILENIYTIDFINDTEESAEEETDDDAAADEEESAEEETDDDVEAPEKEEKPVKQTGRSKTHKK